jgi:choline dehydrogenase-like flavoprotein
MVDYIIIGGGSAGCVLANRLCERRDTTVMLLEAGGRDRRKEIHIPAAWPNLFKTEVDWAFFTDEQPHLRNRRMYWPRGKVLGGSSSINALIYTHGNRRDFEAWQRAGNSGWDFAGVEPSFRKSAIRTSSAAPGHLWSRAFLEACADAGIPPIDDFNGPQQEGAGFFRVTVHDGKRCSTADAYLAPALSRPNLSVRTHAIASKIVVESNRATGVEFLADGRRHTESARREIILCAGAIASPHLLLLSGIGPAAHVESFGIRVVHDTRGVGAQLHDHVLCGVVHESTQPLSMADAGTLSDIVRYLLTKKGRLVSNLAEAGAFIRTRRTLDRPDIELIFAPLFYMHHGFANPKGHGFSIGVVLQHPASRGHLALKSADVLDAPSIQPNYFAAPEDAATLLAGVRLARRVARARAFDPYRGKEVWPGEQAQSDEEIIERFREQAETLYHPAGTCRMGTDAMAVVDDRLRVHGIEGLRVVDASIMPSPITGHPNAVVIMCAEKASALIAEEEHAAV